MHRLFFHIVLLLVLLCPVCAYADYVPSSKEVDSLIKELNETKQKNNRLVFLDKISIGLSRFNPEFGLKFGQEELALAQKIKSSYEEAKAYSNIGNNYFSKGNSADALKAFFKSMQLFETVGNRKEYGYLAGNVGGVTGN